MEKDTDVEAEVRDVRLSMDTLFAVSAQDRQFIEGLCKADMAPGDIAALYEQIHPKRLWADPAAQERHDSMRAKTIAFILSNPDATPEKLTDDEIRIIGLDAARFLKNDPSANFLALRYEEGPHGQMIDHQIDPAVGERFDAHGIRKGSEEAQLRSLLNFLDNGIDPARDFHSAPLELAPEKRQPGMGSAGGTVDKESSNFIIMGDVDTPLTAGIRHVIVMPPFHAHIEKLRSTYPNVTFIASNEAKTTLAAIAGSKK